MLAAFNLATAPAQPQSAASPVPGGADPSAYTYWSIVLPVSYLFFQPDPGIGFAY
jgi:hypothetical protein